MATMKPSEVKALALSVGFGDTDALIATAVCMATTNGDTNFHLTTPNTRVDVYGLMAIDMSGDKETTNLKLFGITANSQLFDATVNMRSAFALWKIHKWNPWVAYTNGSYKSTHILAQIELDTNDKTAAAAGGLFVDLANDTGIPSAFSWIGDLVKSSIAEIVAVIAGIALLFVGVKFLADRNKE